MSKHSGSCPNGLNCQ